MGYLQIVLKGIGLLTLNNRETFNELKRYTLENLIPDLKKIKDPDKFVTKTQKTIKIFDYQNDLANRIFKDSFIRRIFPTACQLCADAPKKKNRELIKLIIWMIEKSPDTYSRYGRMTQIQKALGYYPIAAAFPLVETAKKIDDEILNANDLLKREMAKGNLWVATALKQAERELETKYVDKKFSIFEGVGPNDWAKVLRDREKEWGLTDRFFYIRLNGIRDLEDFKLALFFGEEDEIDLAEKWLRTFSHKNKKLWDLLDNAKACLKKLRDKETDKP